MVRVALILLILFSALPFAAVVSPPNAHQSDVRAEAVRPTEPSKSVETPTYAGGTPSSATSTAGTTRIEASATVDIGPLATAVPNEPLPTSTPAPPLTGVEYVIATRGDHRLPHDITLVASLRRFSWGRHGTEDNPTLPEGNDTVAPWLVVERDASQIDADLDIRFNIRNIRCYVYQPSLDRWVEIFSGLPGWMVSSDVTTADGYDAVTPTIEPDGSYSFEVPAERALHMASGVWRPEISESSGVVTVVEARLIGSDAGQALVAVSPGADFRTGDDYDTTNQAGFGHLGLLTSEWLSYPMLSSDLTDDEVRTHPPPFD